MKTKTAVVAGASGLVGKTLLYLILNGQEYERVYIIVRNPLGIKHPKLIEVVCNFDKLEEIQDYFEVDDVFCCLGTTIKKAKTKSAMYKVDVEYPLTMAKLAKEKEANHFLLISSMNANSKSLLWYPRMKGILEENIQGISIHSVSILRPSLLLGNREEFRLGEAVASKVFYGLSIFLKDSWKSGLAIEAKTVAEAMYSIAQKDKKGVMIYPANKLESIATTALYNR